MKLIKNRMYYKLPINILAKPQKFVIFVYLINISVFLLMIILIYIN